MSRTWEGTSKLQPCPIAMNTSELAHGRLRLVDRKTAANGVVPATGRR
jgi:hypothetical protein